MCFERKIVFQVALAAYFLVVVVGGGGKEQVIQSYLCTSPSPTFCFLLFLSFFKTIRIAFFFEKKWQSRQE